MDPVGGLFLAGVAKLVYALDLGSSAARRESSSLSFRTKLMAELPAVFGLQRGGSNMWALQAPDSNWLMRNNYAGIY